MGQCQSGKTYTNTTNTTNKSFWKITNEEENHHGFQYKNGLNVDTQKFQKSGTCVKGGLYFTDSENIYNFFNYGVWLREVFVPYDAKMVLDPGTDTKKYRANKLYLGNRYPLYDIRTLKKFPWLCKNNTDITNWAAKNGHLETLKWIRANGGKCTKDAANWAARNGHLETLKWIRANGGEWTHWAADYAAENGHLETLKWIRTNGGEWTSDAADWAARNGHLETLKWIRANGGEWTSSAANWAAGKGQLETLKWIRENGGE